MNLFSFTRPLVIAVPALCLMFLLGIGWYGYAQSSSDQGGEIQVDLSTPVTLDDLTPQAATTAITVAGASVEDNEFTPEQLPTIQSGDILAISVLGTMLESPIRGRYRVEPSGKVALGAPYGRVSVGGLNVEEAEDAITLFLKRLLQEPYVSVTFDHLPGDAVGQSSQRKTKLRPGESLRVRAGAGGSLEPIIDDVVQIEASGKVALPSLYKRLDAASRSIESLEEEIRSILAQRYKQPAVLITRISDGQADTSGIEAKLGEIERTLEEIKRKLK